MNTCCVCEVASAMLVRKNNMYNEYISLVLAKNPSPHLAEKMLTSPKTLCWKFQILSRFSLLDRVSTVAQSNQWMDDLKHICGFVYSFWFTYKKGSVKANSTKQKIYIVFGPDRSKWTSGLSWCEYTLKRKIIKNKFKYKTPQNERCTIRSLVLNETVLIWKELACIF